MRFPLLFGACCASLLTAQAADAPKAATPPAEPTYLTPETAGPDFLLQGEYGGDKLGADVIALGKDTFRLVLHKGGLPGAGWDGSAKTEVEGKRSGEGVSFAGAIKAELKDGALSGQTADGEGFVLKRVVRHSPTEGAQPPVGAVILFDGSNADAWNGGHLDERKLLAAGTTSKQAFQDFSSSCRSSPSVAARAVPTAASTSRTATRSRCSTASDSRASITSAVGSTRTAPPR